MEDLQSCGEPGGLWFSKYQLIIWLCEKLCMYLSVKWAAGQVLWHGGFYHSGGCLDCRAAEFLMSLMSKPWDKRWERATHIERTQEQCRSFKQTWPPKLHCAWTTLWEINAFCYKTKALYRYWERSRFGIQHLTLLTPVELRSRDLMGNSICKNVNGYISSHLIHWFTSITG